MRQPFQGNLQVLIYSGLMVLSGDILFFKKVNRTQAVINFISSISTVYVLSFLAKRESTAMISLFFVFANSLLLWEMLEWLSKTRRYLNKNSVLPFAQTLNNCHLIATYHSRH